jgi:tetratricopeptide (TPR) repeat protein
LRPTTASAEPAPALALLDNVELALPVSRLLDTAAPLGLTTLLTCRSEPSSPRVRLVRLESLALDAGVQLFAARYQARGGSWSAERDAPVTRAIAEALGGLPLAIELAAAHAAHTRLPLAALLEELQAPDALTRLSDPLDRSASVRYSLGKTLAALSPIQRVRFATLGVLEGPDWPREVIEALFTGVPAVPASPAENMPANLPASAHAPSTTAAQADLEALLAFSLAGVGIRQFAGAESGPRVRLHPLVRELAREQWAGLPTVDQEAALHGLLVGLQDWVATFFNSSAYLHIALDEELIAGALRTAAAQQVELPLLISIVNGWDLYLSIFRTRLELEMRTLQLASARTLGDHQTELAALHAVGSGSSALGCRDEALRCWREALALARERGDRVAIIPFLCDVGRMLADSGSRADAEQMYEEAATLAGELGEHLTD